jgi:hypothetical protein
MSKDNEKYNISLPEGKDKVEIILREGQAAKALDPKEPEKIIISGVLDSPLMWLVKRVEAKVGNDEQQIDQHASNIIVDRDKMTITLTVDETNYYKTIITGKLEYHPKFVEFGINSSKTWAPNKLGQFFKMNRAFFPDKSKNMELVTALKNFNAKVSQNIDKVKNDNGSFADNFSAEVEANIPGSFSVKLTVFKGTSAEVMEVEFYATVDGREVDLSLVSPGANELVEEYRDKCIDSVLEEIRVIAPNIVIIEQ